MTIIELAGIGPGPFCAMMLSDMGADVLRITEAQWLADADFHRHVDELAARFAVGLLQRQRLVVDEPACPSEAAHVALLLAVRAKLELEGLETQHD